MPVRDARASCRGRRRTKPRPGSGALRALAALALLLAPTWLAAQAEPELAVDPQPVLTLGGTVDAAPEVSFTEIGAVAVLGDSILVLEQSANEIRVFDHRGRFLGRIGRSGEGPGEFQWPTAMWLVPEGIVVVDLKLRRESTFTLAGALVRTRPLGRLGGQPLGGSAELRGGAVVAQTSVTASSEIGTFPERLVVAMAATAGPVDTLARYSTGYVPFRAAGSFGFLSASAGSEGAWSVAGDSLLVVVAGEPPVLRWWRADEAGLVPGGEVPLPLRPAPFSSADAERLFDRSNETLRAEGYEPVSRSASMDPPRYWGQVKRLVVSDREACWIQWDDPADDEDDVWFRVELDGRRLERVRLPVGFRMLAAAGDALYGTTIGAYDIPAVTVLRLRHPPSR